MRHDGGTGRGRHRRRNSPETKAWHEIAPQVDGWPEPEPKRNKFGIPVLPGPAPDKDAEAERTSAPPERPAWLADDETWRLLLEMRKGLQR